MRSNEKLLEKNAADGNLPIDMLFCVPPGDQVQGEQGKSRSNLARNLSEWGHDVWDGTDLEVRRSAPIRVSQHRVVQYDSCRGLEGWIVVNYALDDFLTSYGAKSRPTQNASNSRILEAGTIVALGPAVTAPWPESVLVGRNFPVPERRELAG